MFVSLSSILITGSALTINDERPPESFGIMCLENVQHLATLTNARSSIGALRARFEVDEQAYLLLLGWNEVDDTFEHEHHMLHLPRRDLGVLASWVEIMAGAALLIKPDNDLLSSLVLRRYMLRGQVLNAVFPPPGQCLEQSLLSLVLVPFGGPKVSQQTLFCEPYLLILS